MKLGLIVMGLAGTAHADDRMPSVHLGAMGVIAGADATEEEIGLESYGGFRATLAYEQPPAPYPDKRGNVYTGSLVPELIAGAFERDDRYEMMLGAGVRAELRITQREGGLLRLNAKAAVYLAGRGMVVGADRDAMLEGALGYYLYLGSPLRLGFELAATDRRRAQMEDHAGMMVGVYLGYGPR